MSSHVLAKKKVYGTKALLVFFQPAVYGSFGSCMIERLSVLYDPHEGNSSASVVRLSFSFVKDAKLADKTPMDHAGNAWKIRFDKVFLGVGEVTMSSFLLIFIDSV